MDAMRARILIVLAVLVAVLAPTAPAGAHADLVSACPGPGDRLQEVTSIEMIFGEPLLDDGLARIDLLDLAGERFFEVGPVQFSEDRFTVSVEVLEPLEPGFYVARISATSYDGDINGADTGYQFEIDPDASPRSDTCDLPDETTSGGWILLGVGLVAVLALLFFLRPSSAESSTDRTAKP